MHTNYYFLRQLAPALDEKLSGLQLLACFSQDKDELVLGWGDDNREVYLRCNVSPQFSGLYLTDTFGRARRNSVNLWPEISGLRTEKVSVASYERVLKIRLENSYTLIIKFFGNRPNIILYKEDLPVSLFNNQLVSDLNLLISNFDKTQEPALSDFIASGEKSEKVYFTFGKIVHSAIRKALEKDDITDPEKKWDLINTFRSRLENPPFHLGFFQGMPVLSLIPEELEIIQTCADPVEALNAFYIFHQKTVAFSKERTTLLNDLQKEEKQTRIYLQEAYQRLENLQNTIKNEEVGHILMANLHEIPAGAAEVTLFDFYRNREILIKLKKDLSGQKNAEQYYRKSKNEKIEQQKTEENILARELKLEVITQQLRTVEQAKSLKELRTISKDTANSAGKKGMTTGEAPFRKFSEDGFEIWVGRNARNNDLLTQQYAHKEDLWLHARDSPGSHVIIRHQSGKKIPGHVIEKAGGLAAWFSKRKNENMVPVIVTPRKFIRKAKGLAEGQVIVEKETVVMATPFDPGTL